MERLKLKQTDEKNIDRPRQKELIRKWISRKILKNNLPLRIALSCILLWKSTQSNERTKTENTDYMDQEVESILPLAEKAVLYWC